MHTRLFCSLLPYIISHHESLGCFKPLYNSMIAQVLVSQSHVTFDGSQGHLNWYQTAAFSGIHHHTKFQRNLFTIVKAYINAKCKCYQITYVNFFPLNNDRTKWFSINVNASAVSQETIQPLYQSANKPSSPSTSQPINHPAPLPVSQSTIQCLYQSANQPSSPSTSQPINHPVPLPVSQSTIQRLYQPINHPVPLPVSQSTIQRLYQSANQPSSTSTSQPTIQHLYQSINQSAPLPVSLSTIQPLYQSANQPSSPSTSQLINHPAPLPVSHPAPLPVILPVS